MKKIRTLVILFVTTQMMKMNPKPFANAFAQRKTCKAIDQKRNLLQQASNFRQIINCQRSPSLSTLLPPPSSLLYYSSSYKQKTGPRGFCNWILPNYIMVGQYPGTTPEISGPLLDEVQDHINLLVKRSKPLDTRNNSAGATDGTGANICMFCSLQDEVPSQNDYDAWDRNNGKVQLPVGGGREDFPRYFSHYAPMVVESLVAQTPNLTKDQDSLDESYIQFHHAPILDLSTPDSSSLLNLLSTLLESLILQNPHGETEEKNGINSHGGGGAVYIHCWGGRGRAGLVSACLLSLIFPELSAEKCLDWVQRGYDSRDGARFMSPGLRKSPQTATQRLFVRDFVDDMRRMQ